MTYLNFLLIFVVSPALLLLWRLRRRLSAQEVALLLLLLLIAVVYTSPWDNYLVATGVWWYDPALVTGLTIAWVPIEEYAFFALQTLLTGLWLLFLLRWTGSFEPNTSKPMQRIFPALVLGLVWIAMAVVLLLAWRPGTYLALELLWGLPPILLQLVFGADLLWRRRRLVIATILSATIYLSFADWLAIGAGTWTIDPEQSLNVYLGGHLPVEEAVFFLLTNTLVVFGLTLGLAPESLSRLPKRLRKYLPELSGAG